MKQSKTTIKELTAAYRAVLRHGILCNAIALGLIAAAPARAETITYSDYNGNQGALSIIDRSEHISGDALVFENNTSSSHGAGLYYKVTDDGLSSSVVLDANTITFNNNISSANASSGGAVFNSGGDVSILGATNTFTNNQISGVDEAKSFKRGGGAVANQSYETESNSEPKVALDATMVIGKLDGTSENTFSNNTSSMNGGAIMNRALDTDGNATLTINGATTFNDNTAAMNGGAIYNVQRDGKTATVNLNNGEYTFTGNTATLMGGAVYNEGTMTLENGTFNNNKVFGTSTEWGEGGAINNAGTMTVTNTVFGGEDENGNIAERGGAINNAGTITVNNAGFINNVASNMGGAINADAGTVIVNNSEFIGNDGGIYGGAIASVFNTVNKIEVNDSDFAGNRAQLGGAIAAYQTLEITNSNFTNNETTIVEDGGGAIVLGGHGKATITGTTFDGNKSNLGGAIATRPRGTNALGDGYGAANADGHWLVVENSIFTNNVADATLVDAENGTIHTYGGKSMYNGDGGAIWHGFEGSTVNGIVHNNEINNSQFSLNIARHNGGAIYNEGNLILTDDTFTNNSADGLGGAIFNEGNMTIAAMDSDVDFHGNTANGEANDIYNAGNLTLNAAEDRVLSLAGGINGLNGTLDIGGHGLVDISNSLDNQTVNVGSGQLHLSDPMTLDNTMITVATGAALNTLDGAINDYSAHTALGNNSSLFVDVSADGIDKFGIQTGNRVSVDGFTMLSDLAGDSEVRHLADYGYVTDNPTFKSYTTNSVYTLTGNSANDGTVTINKIGTGGLSAAITDTSTDGRYYSLTGNDTSVTSNVAVMDTDVTVNGAGIEDGDYGITLGATIGVGNGASLEILNAKVTKVGEGNGAFENDDGAQTVFSGSKIDVDVTNDGTVGIFDTTLVAGNRFENRAGATALVFDSVIGADVLNSGQWISDPSTYTGQFENEGFAKFDADTFASTAVLNNAGTVDLKNGVTFDAGAEIFSDGVINLVSGTTHFNNTVSSNTINLRNGADFDGMLTGTGALNMANGAIETVTGGVAGGNLYLDANLRGTGTIDTLTAGTTGAKIKSINILGAEYGDAESLSLNVGGATLDEDLQINGMNYYTKVEKDGDNLVFSDKLINRSTLDSELALKANSNDLAAIATSGAASDLTQDDNHKLVTAEQIASWTGKQNALTAGNGVVLSGDAISVKAGNSTILVDENGVKVGTIEASNIAANAITTDKIANGTITFADLNSDMISSSSTMNVAAPSDEKLVTEAAVVAGINALVSEKETWVNNTLGITASEPNAVNTEYTGTNYLAAETTLTGADKALDSALKNTNDTIGAGEIGAGTAGNLAGQTIGSGTGNTTVTAALETLNATNVAQNASLNTMAGIVNGATVDPNTGALTGGTALNAGTNGSNLVAATNTLSQMLNNNGADTITHLDFQTENMNVDANKSIVANLNVIGTELQNAESRVKVLEDNMIKADTEATFTNKTIDADANTITNLTVGNFKNTAISNEITEDGDASKLATDKAVRDAINEKTNMGENAGTNYAANATVVDAIKTIDQNLGKIDDLITDQTSDKTSNNRDYNGNLAQGATVEDHLLALDASVGDMRDFASDNNYATDTESVANNITLLDTQAKSNADSIATLNGDESTEGSVRNIAKHYFDLAAQNDALTLSQANAYTDERIEKLDKNMSSGIASAVALSSVAVSDVRRGELSVGAGYGYFNGQSAGAFGAAMGISNRWSVNAGAGISGYDVSFRAGTNYKFKLF